MSLHRSLFRRATWKQNTPSLPGGHGAAGLKGCHRRWQDPECGNRFAGFLDIQEMPREDDHRGFLRRWLSRSMESLTPLARHSFATHRDQLIDDFVCGTNLKRSHLHTGMLRHEGDRMIQIASLE